MAVDASVEGLSVTQKWTYDWRDVILYNLSVGADSNVNPDELCFTWEKQLKAVPAFSSMTMGATFGAEPNVGGLYMPTNQIEGWPNQGVLHMDHAVTMYKPCDPMGATLTSTKTIKKVYDRGEGKGIKMMVDIESRDENGELVFVNHVGIFNSLCKSFGGEQPPKSDINIPAEEEPDYTVDGATDPRCNEIFRLTGDTFELHIDPEFAAKSGFPRPITHGLCNYGYANRLLVEHYIPGEPERMKTFGCQFRTVAFPGEEFTVKAWKTGEKSIVFQMISKANGKPTLDRGFMTWE